MKIVEWFLDYAKRHPNMTAPQDPIRPGYFMPNAEMYADLVASVPGPNRGIRFSMGNGVLRIHYFEEEDLGTDHP